MKDVEFVQRLQSPEDLCQVDPNGLLFEVSAQSLMLLDFLK